MKKAIIICLAAILITALCLPSYAALNNSADENTPYLSISSGGATIYPDAGIFWRGVCDPESGAWLEEEYGPGAEGVKSVPLIRYKGEITENSVSYTVYGIEGYESPNGSMEIEYIDRFLKRAGKGVYRITAHFSVTDSEHNTYFQYEAPFDVEVENDPVYNGEYDVVQDGISYLDCGAYCEIVYAAGSLTGDVVIPSYVNISGRDLPVRSVQKQAFQNAEYIKSVVLPDGLTTIGISAFENCKSLQSIAVPESVTSIGTGAFNNCGQLKSITIPENIKKIESSTFFCCSSLESITIPGNVTKIDQFAFSRCTGLTSIDIPDSVTEIMESAFENCTGVKTVTVGSGLQTMHRKAFSGCDAVDTLIISEDNPTYYSKGNCFISKNMNGVVMVFKNSVIPEDENITSIDGSLYNYRSEKVIRIPANIKLIDHAAFYECSSLETVYYGGTIDQWENVVIGSYNKYLRRATIVCTNGKVIGDEEFYDTDDTPEDPADRPLKGDCSGDGAVDNKDVVILFRYVSGTGKTGDESVYDFNGDGEINNKDVAALFRALSAENAPGQTNEKQITEIIHYNVQTYAFGENGEGYREPEYEGKELIKPVEKSKKDGMDDKTLHIFGKDYTLKYGETYDYGLYDEKYDQYYGSDAWFMFGEKTGRIALYLNFSDKPAEGFVSPVNESSDQEAFVDYAKSLLYEYFDMPTDDCDVKVKKYGSEYRITFYKIFSGVYRIDKIEVEIRTDGSLHSVRCFTCDQKFERFKNIKINADWLNRWFGGRDYYLSYEYTMQAIPDGYNLWVMVDTEYTYEEDEMIWGNGDQYVVKVAEAYKEVQPDTENGKYPVYLTVKCGYNTIYPDAYPLWSSMYLDEEGEWIEGGGTGAEEAKSVPEIRVSDSDLKAGYKKDGNGVKVSYRVDGYEDGKYLTLKELNKFLLRAAYGRYRVVAVVTVTGRNVGVQYEESCWEYPFDVIK